MSSETENYLVTLDGLGIDVDKIVHILLTGETELVAEIVEDNECPDYVLINPIKILKEQYVDEDNILREYCILTEWNSSINDPVIQLKKPVVVSVSKPSDRIIELYSNAVKGYYFPDEPLNDISFDEEMVQEVSPTSNVICLKTYKKNKGTGTY